MNFFYRTDPIKAQGSQEATKKRVLNQLKDKLASRLSEHMGSKRGLDFVIPVLKAIAGQNANGVKFSFSHIFVGSKERNDEIISIYAKCENFGFFYTRGMSNFGDRPLASFLTRTENGKKKLLLDLPSVNGGPLPAELSSQFISTLLSSAKPDDYAGKKEETGNTVLFSGTANITITLSYN